MILLDLSFALVLLATAAGIWAHFDNRKASKRVAQKTVLGLPRAKPGYVYFAGSEQPDTPIRIGTTATQPKVAAVEDGSPLNLKILHVVQTFDLNGTVSGIVEDLKEYHLRQGWFDRDATLYYIDHLKGRC